MFLNVLPANENDNDGIIEIMKSLQKYRASAGDGEQRLYKRTKFQLTNCFTPEQRFENMHFEAADIHAEIKFMQVFKYKQFHATFVKNITASWSFQFYLFVVVHGQFI